MTVLEHLERVIQPRYVGWQDQYRAVLRALGIPFDADIKEVKLALSLLEDK